MTTMTDIDHVVFDIGQILIHYDPNIPFKRIIPDASERQWFFDTVCTSPWNIEQDRGRTWAIDDSLPNIEAARTHGWHGVHLPPGADLQTALRGYNIST